MKEKYAMTEMRKQQNIIPFGEEAQKEYRQSGVGFGLMGSSGGKLRVATKKDQSILKKRQ